VHLERVEYNGEASLASAEVGQTRGISSQIERGMAIGGANVGVHRRVPVEYLRRRLLAGRLGDEILPEILFQRINVRWLAAVADVAVGTD
jgi:hypothetical protein